MRGTVFHVVQRDAYQVRRLIRETADESPALIDRSSSDRRVDEQRIGMLGHAGQDR